MARRAATDEICVTGGMGNAPSSKRRGLVRVSAWCLLAPKDLACQHPDHASRAVSTLNVKAVFTIKADLNGFCIW